MYFLLDKKVLPIFIGTGAESRLANKQIPTFLIVRKVAKDFISLTFLDTRKVTKEYAL